MPHPFAGLASHDEHVAVAVILSSLHYVVPHTETVRRRFWQALTLAMRSKRLWSGLHLQSTK